MSGFNQKIGWCLLMVPFYNGVISVTSLTTLIVLVNAPFVICVVHLVKNLFLFQNLQLLVDLEVAEIMIVLDMVIIIITTTIETPIIMVVDIKVEVDVVILMFVDKVVVAEIMEVEDEIMVKVDEIIIKVENVEKEVMIIKAV